jgi:AcrR family transcriptional regulator
MSTGQRRDRTERRVVDAATRLFLRDGYAKTSLAAVAAEAGVAERTLYVRFASKVVLFQRVIQAGVVGDIYPVPLPERDWSRASMSAATLEDRIRAFAEGVSDMLERLGPLMSVNGEVEPSEPSVQESAGVARADTLLFLRAFWEGADRDGLLPPHVDVDWLVDTSTVLAAAETRLLITRTLGWDRDAFRDWILLTWPRLIAGASGPDRST